MPSPDVLGVAAAPARSAETDWAATRRRLQELGAVAFQVLEQPDGWRFVCRLRTAEPGRLHRIEAGPAATEAEAVALALAEADRWAPPPR